MSLEKHLVESHSALCMNIHDDSLKKLFANLNSGNQAHIGKLEKFQSG